MSRDGLRGELIQVGAVAVAIVEDLDVGVAYVDDSPSATDSILMDIYRERVRQDRKWGPRHQDRKLWLAILAEEVGEVAEEVPIPGPMDTRSRVDYVLDDMVRAGRRARRYLEELDAA